MQLEVNKERIEKAAIDDPENAASVAMAVILEFAIPRLTSIFVMHIQQYGQINSANIIETAAGISDPGVIL